MKDQNNKKERNPEKRSGKPGAARITVSAVLFAIEAFLCLGLTWLLSIWHDITFDEIVFYLSAPLEGTSHDVMNSFYLRVVLISVIALIIFIVLMVVLVKKKKYRMFRTGIAVVFAALSIFLVCQAARCVVRYRVIDYVRSRTTKSDFIDQNYVEPTSENVIFPEKKRNLVYIFLESVETTFADKEHGGAFEKNAIPELTRLATTEGESFSGDRKTLNGGYVTTGSSYTMGALVAQTSGVPIIGSIGNAAASYADSFYPGLRTIGDILKEQGYNQVFMCGSEATFGGRALYFREHGGYQVFDYDYARNNGYIPKDYRVWWGYEDKKLLEFAKKRLTELNGEGRPFNLTMLTVDTHFEDGFVCDLCKDEFDVQYSNVMACSSRQISGFIAWMKEQDFYKDTTVVLVGDHPTMDADYCKAVEDSYGRRSYVCILNSAVEVKDSSHRDYTTYDLFPTTLAAMGVRIKGNRLGLGINLFSETPTLMERYGIDFLSKELGKKSAFYDRIGKFDMLSKDILKNLDYLDVKTSVDSSGKLNVSFWGIENCRQEIRSVRGEFYTADGNLLSKQDLMLDAAKVYSCVFDTSALSFREIFTGKIKLFATDSEGAEHEFYATGSNESALKYKELSDYLNALGSMEDITVLIGIKDEAARGLDLKTVEAFGKLGLDCTLFGREGSSYLAVSGKDKKLENAAINKLTYKGTFKDGTEYEIISGALRYGNVCSIVIGGEEYSANKRGFNIAVYDDKSGRVIDCRSFDVYKKTIASSMSDETLSVGLRYDPEKKTADIWMTGNRNDVLTGKPVYAFMYTWDKDHPAQYSRIEMKKGRYGSEGSEDSFEYFFLKDFDVSSYDPKTMGIMIFITSSESGVVQYKCKGVYDLTSGMVTGSKLPQGVTLTEA
ncbi:MAG: sulfatase-like hydrolase/transferase [Clostridiales bacterium]|nr:sulfatase-like hydrolase/transferase [Clostridiales bacterium]